jgi:hypothetical protein
MWNICRWEDNTNMNLQELRYDDVHYIRLVYDQEKWSIF